ncbi:MULTISPECIES: hypothetical protein [unclassified Methylosinus]|nr:MULTISPECIES: hypothetical protein [unclassified Methylosinus]
MIHLEISFGQISRDPSVADDRMDAIIDQRPVTVLSGERIVKGIFGIFG